jgi:addiction module RelB/DinJ family antitoxin
VYCTLQYSCPGECGQLRYTYGMELMTRTATLQMRVTPGVKYASEKIFHRIGLSMTAAMELFLRRVIVDEKLPFEVVALDSATLARIVEDVSVQSRSSAGGRNVSKRKTHSRPRSKGG